MKKGEKIEKRGEKALIKLTARDKKDREIEELVVTVFLHFPWLGFKGIPKSH